LIAEKQRVLAGLIKNKIVDSKKNENRSKSILKQTAPIAIM